MEFDAVFFDLDDTLYPYPPCNAAGKAAAWRAARDRGYDLDREAFEDLYQEGRRAVKRELGPTAASHERFLYFKQGLRIHAGTDRPGDALALGEAYWSGYVEEMEPFDGAEATLSALDEAGVDLAVVPNLTTRIQLRKVEHLGIGPYLDVLLTSEETGREKPGSVMFTLPLARLGRRPGETLMVGDSVEADVEGANAVGLTTALFDGEETDLAGRRRPDHRVEDFAEVRGLVL